MSRNDSPDSERLGKRLRQPISAAVPSPTRLDRPCSHSGLAVKVPAMRRTSRRHDCAVRGRTGSNVVAAAPEHYADA